MIAPDDRQRGTAAVEVAMILPLLVVLALSLTAGWRVNYARGQLTEAAAAGARAASIPISAAAARMHGESAITADLATAGLHCRDLTIQVDTSAYWLPVGNPGQVQVAVSCLVELSDLIVPGLPGGIHLSAVGSQPLDTFRERTP